MGRGGSVEERLEIMIYPNVEGGVERGTAKADLVANAATWWVLTTIVCLFEIPHVGTMIWLVVKKGACCFCLESPPNIFLCKMPFPWICGSCSFQLRVFCDATLKDQRWTNLLLAKPLMHKTNQKDYTYWFIILPSARSNLLHPTPNREPVVENRLPSDDPANTLFPREKQHDANISMEDDTMRMSQTSE